eukprot:2468233-Rhodomonas_salina.1
MSGHVSGHVTALAGHVTRGEGRTGGAGACQSTAPSTHACNHAPCARDEGLRVYSLTSRAVLPNHPQRGFSPISARYSEAVSDLVLKSSMISELHMLFNAAMIPSHSCPPHCHDTPPGNVTPPQGSWSRLNAPWFTVKRWRASRVHLYVVDGARPVRRLVTCADPSLAKSNAISCRVSTVCASSELISQSVVNQLFFAQSEREGGQTLLASDEGLWILSVYLRDGEGGSGVRGQGWRLRGKG